MYVFTLHLDDYLMFWFSLRAFILVFSKFKYSLETSTTMLNNIWVRINSRKNSWNIKRLLRKEVFQVYRFKTQKSKTVRSPGIKRTSQEPSLRFFTQDRSHSSLAFLGRNWFQDPTTSQPQSFYSLREQSDLLTARTWTWTLRAMKGCGRHFI